MSGKDRVSGTVDPEVAEYLDSLDNKSAYLNELIRQDMQLETKSERERLQERLNEVNKDLAELEGELEEKKNERETIREQIEEIEQREKEQKELLWRKLRHALRVPLNNRQPDTWTKAVENTGLTTEQFQALVKYTIGDERRVSDDRELTSEERDRAEEWLNENH